MVTAENIGRFAVVRAKDSFYAFVDGWKGRITGISNGLASLEQPAMENGETITKVFYIPVEELDPA